MILSRVQVTGKKFLDDGEVKHAFGYFSRGQKVCGIMCYDATINVFIIVSNINEPFDNL